MSSAIPTRIIGKFDRLDVIDAIRGYAILLVIFVHCLSQLPTLVWPAKRVFLMGFYGVQLFFIASAMTLLMSWARDNDIFFIKAKKFFVRRFFRIAPLYYLAIPFYWVAYQRGWPDFDIQIFIASLLFYNAWSPYLLPTVPGWTPVPGGWSISVEFCFYLIFPLLAVMINSISRSLLFFIISIGLLVLNAVLGDFVYQDLGVENRDNFLYFWLPNQLAIFSIGFVLFNVLKNDRVLLFLKACPINSGHVTIVVMLALLGLSLYGVRKFFVFPAWALPTHLIASILFLIWAAILIVKPVKWVVNRAIVGLGRVSFSAYILHFAVIKYLGIGFGAMWIGSKDGYYSIFYALVFVAGVLLVTRILAGASYRFIELPFIKYGAIISKKIRN